MSGTSSPTTSASSSERPAGRWRTLLGTGVGNALEWYDWNVYAVFTPFFAQQFFNANNSTSAVLSSLAVFAVGFLMRPLGGLLFGWLAGYKGRKIAMTASIGCAAGGSLIIGLAPTYAVLGVGASLVLVVARLAQGLAHGGELPAAQTYISEIAPREGRGLWSSLIYGSGTCGVLLGTLVGAILASVMDNEALTAWGWRIPFLIGGVFGLYALYLRNQLAETEAFQEERAQRGTDKPPMWRGLWEWRRNCLKVIGLTLGTSVVFYTWVVAAPAYAINVKGIDQRAALWIGVAANVVFIILMPLYGALSDRIGRKPLIYFASIGLAIVTIPLNHLINGQAWQLAVAMLLAMAIMAAYSSIAPALYAEMFPTQVRAAGMGLPYSLAVAVCGGTAPYLQTWSANFGNEDLFLGYSAILLLVTALVTWRIPETKGCELR